MIKGRIHSLQSLGTVDGPGVRFVAFLQGCNLRCGCCHNPDTWDMNGGKEYSAEEIVAKAERCREYFGPYGGVTLSGGEPLLQPVFVKEIFALCHQKGINTCLDTSGSVMNEDVMSLLDETDRVLLDIKYTEEELYKKYVGCSMNGVFEFLNILEQNEIPTTIRQVIIPTLNDNEENILRIKDIADRYSCVDKIELLPFKKICSMKYQNMGIDFPFANIPEPSHQLVSDLSKIIKDYL